MQEVLLYPQEKIEIKFTKGIIDGIKTIQLIPIENETELEVNWDVKLSGMMGMFTGMVMTFQSYRSPRDLLPMNSICLISKCRRKGGRKAW